MTAPATAPAGLNATDLRALHLLADGLTVAQVATRLGVGNSAACMRLLRLRERLGARTNAHAIAIAVRTGQLNLTQEAA